MYGQLLSRVVVRNGISAIADGTGAAGDEAPGHTKEVTMNRKLWWAVLAIGLALVIAPLALGLPEKAAAGERMMTGFQPIMQPAHVNTTARYYTRCSCRSARSRR
jgi:hypothetical protein